MRLISLLIAATLVNSCACLSPTRREDAMHALVERGRMLAASHCASCHAIGPVGESPAPEAPPLRGLSPGFRATTLETALNQGLPTGHPAMPELQFPKRDVDAVIAYLESVQESPR
jgi:mono/diheme cytochrome c family protein